MSLNKVALITGSSRGIGAQTAKTFAENGYSICVNYVSDEKAAHKIQKEIQAIGVKCIIVKADVSNQQEVTHLFAQADELGPLTVLVNNAGILMQQTSIEDISLERFTHILNANILSCFMCTQQAIKRMSSKYGGVGGAIVNVSSKAAISGAPFEYVDYAASKGAMDTFTIGTAKELANQGIRVNGVRPGLIHTDMHTLGGEPNRVERLQSIIPLNRGGQASEVAQAIYWLASNKSSFVTGTFIDVTGGL